MRSIEREVTVERTRESTRRRAGLRSGVSLAIAALAWSCGVFLLAAAGAALAGGSSEADRQAAEDLVRPSYFEGLPFAQARAITEDGALSLAAMLADPGEVAHHANALEALGIAGRAGAYEAIATYAASEPADAVDAHVYAARLAIPLALGHLARSDDRALAALLGLATSSSAPGWSYHHLAGERLADVLRRAAVTGLALCGRTEAGDALEALAGSRSQPALALHAHSALRTHARVAREGADAALRAPFDAARAGEAQ